MTWRTSNEADEDISEIVVRGSEALGLQHAENYLAQLIDTFGLLARHPEMAIERQAANQKVRLMPYQAHHILYVIDDGDVHILRVLHHLQDWFDLV